MLPTKLASAALRGTRSTAAVPPGARFGVLMTRSPGSAGGIELVVPDGRPGGARCGQRCGVAVLRGGRGLRPLAVPGRCRYAGLSAAYVPTGYVPNGGVT